ncbi:POK8 protein, partial [Nothocercus julius]|nr:POK8 protein [Nothocercus julius]
IRPQRVKIGTGPIKMLHDLQRLLGVINWIQPVIGLTNEELRPLFFQLQGDLDLNSP